jgi:predicted XRE-type DNA-binding protein
MMNTEREDTVFVVGSGNIFADLGLDDADEQIGKAQLAARIRQIIKAQGLTQAQAAKVLGTTQARISELYNGKIAQMTYDRLLGFLNTLDCDVSITITPRATKGPHSRGRTLVAA